MATTEERTALADKYKLEALLEQYKQKLSAQKKETAKVLRDSLNKYKSWHAQQTVTKLDRSPNFKYETELLAKIELLKELQKKLL